MKKVSVIIPCYNQEKYVVEALDSVLNQTYKNIQIVIVNDCSLDKSSDVIKSYVEKYKNILFFDEEKNSGVVYARNIAIEAADGDYILPLDADDKIDSTFVEKAVKILDEDDDIRIVYSRIQFFGYRNKEFKLAKFSPDKIIFNNCIPNTAMFRKVDFVAVGGYKSYMKDGWEDWNLWLSILDIAPNRHKCAYKIDEKLYWYRQFKSNSRSDFNLEKKNQLFVNMILNHPNLYSTSTNFYKHIVKSLPSKLEKKNRLIRILLFLFFLLFIFSCFLFWTV